jgi:hypothetical protein
MSEKIENSTAHLLNSMRNHVNALAEGGVIDPVRIRYAIADRKNLAAQFHAQGLSNRESADALGVDERTIRRDLASAANAAPDNKSPLEREAPIAKSAKMHFARCSCWSGRASSCRLSARPGPMTTILGSATCGCPAAI